MISHDIPKMDGNPELTEQVAAIGSGMQVAGQGLMVFGAIFAFLSNHVLNSLLASVRSLGIITHFFMMKL